MAPWQIIIFTPLLAFALAMVGMVFFLLGRTLVKNRRLPRLACDILSVLMFLSILYVIGKALEVAFHARSGVPADSIWMINAGIFLQLFIIVFALHFAWRKKLHVARFIRRGFRKPARSLG